MQAEMYEIIPCPQGRLAIMPRPRGDAWLRAELASLKFRGVTDLVSMLTPAEDAQQGLSSEAQICAELGIRFHRHPVPDHKIPFQPAFDDFITSLMPTLAQNGFIAIHCLAGIGRSTVALAALLRRLGLTAEEAIAAVSQARGFDVPETEEQIDFIFSLNPSRP